MISRESVVIVGVIFGLFGIFSDKLSDNLSMAFCTICLALILVYYVDFLVDLIKRWINKNE